MIQKHLHRIPIVRLLAVRPRLAFAALVAAIVFVILPDDWRPATKILAAWDCGAAFFLMLIAIMMSRTDCKGVRRRAESQDEGAVVFVVVTVLSAIASLGAIIAELAIAKSLTGAAQGQAIGLAAVTVLLTWFFMQTMFALHYAHEYYNAADDGTKDGGLEFPAHFKTPDYWDFIYFSFIIGAAAATADINLTSRSMRRIVTVQCVAVFFYNTTILALAINVGASLAS